MVAVSGIAPDSARLQRAANLSQLHSRGSPVRNRTAVCRLQGGGSAIELRGNKGWSRAPVPPRVSPRPKRGGLLSSSRANYAGMTESSSRSVNEMRSLVFCLLSSVFCLLSSVFCLLSHSLLSHSLLSYGLDGGGRDRTGAWAAYEAAAFPLGYPAVEKWWVVPVTLRRRPIGRLFYRQLTVFT